MQAKKKKPSKKPSKSKPSKAKPSKSSKPSKLTKQQKANIRTFNQLKKDALAMEKDLKKLKKEIEAAKKLAEVSSRLVIFQHITRNLVYYLPGTW